MSTLLTAAEKSAPDAVLIGYPEVARLTSWSLKTLQRMVLANQLPGVIRQGRSVRFHRPTLERWLEERAIGAVN